MRFGVCTKSDNLDIVALAGYDYIEFTLRDIENLSEDAFAALKNTLATSPIKVETTNLFFAADIPLVGPEVSFERIESFCQKALSRAGELGIKVSVIGNGAARKIPEGFDPKEAEAQFVRVLRLCGDIAARHGITIAIEPLRTKETNYINTVAEGIALCRKVAHENVKCLADFYHVLENGETLEAIEAANGLLAHTHLAVENRYMPATAKDAALCAKWAAALKKCGYDGRISLEGHFGEDFIGAITGALPILRETFCRIL